MKALKLSVLALAAVSLAACSSYKTSAREPEQRHMLHLDVDNAIAKFKEQDPTINRFFDNAYGYAVFPQVGKGGFLIGGAHGHGEVYEHGRFIGYASLTQGTIGAQAGGQTYSEVIFFQNADALRDFQEEKPEVAAQASAVAATYGASANADYRNGVAVFSMGEGGLMFEAAVGAQKFNYTPASESETGYAIPSEQREKKKVEVEIHD